jgi:hypothetical protein
MYSAIAEFLNFSQLEITDLLVPNQVTIKEVPFFEPF